MLNNGFIQADEILRKYELREVGKSHIQPNSFEELINQHTLSTLFELSK